MGPKAAHFLTETSTALNLAGIRKEIIGIDKKIPVLNGCCQPYVCLDNAASTPVLKPVLDTLNSFMPWYSSVHRGTGFKSKLSTEVYDEARRIVGNFFGYSQKEHVVIFGKNTTEAINKLSYRLKLTKDDVVLVGMMEHHSNDLPWRRSARIEHIKVDNKGRIIVSDIERLFNKHKNKVKLVAISGGSNVTGFIPPISEIAKIAHRHGAQIFVDCAQLAPHRRVRLKSLDDPEHLDYIAVSAHKMYAPFGTGALIGRKDTFEQGEPEICGGGTIAAVTKDSITWTAPPDKDEAGSPNVVGAVAFAKALLILEQIGMDEIAKHESELTVYALEKLGCIDGLKIYGDEEPANSHLRLGVIPFNIVGMPHNLAAAILGAEWGIGVRNGCFCAHPYVMSLLGLSDDEIQNFKEAARRGDRTNVPGMVRVSFGMYNTKKEIDVLAEALEQIVAGAYEGNYTQDKTTGEYSPAGLPKLSEYFSI